VGDYDPTRPLVIDPVIDYSTYLGGGQVDEGSDIVVDALGTAYMTGNTDSANFPNPGAYQPTLGGLSPGSYFMDAFVTKLAPRCP